jgi:hypothetical protein
MISILVLFFLGLLFIVYDLARINNKCPAQKIIYRYIPKTLEEQQKEPVFVSDVLKNMFTETSPWVTSINDLNTRNLDRLNQYFISQV